nr:MAG TPA: hypothetical protein [Caudoviricetes sp.]
MQYPFCCLSPLPFSVAPSIIPFGTFPIVLSVVPSIVSPCFPVPSPACKPRAFELLLPGGCDTWSRTVCGADSFRSSLYPPLHIGLHK